MYIGRVSFVIILSNLSNYSSFSTKSKICSYHLTNSNTNIKINSMYSYSYKTIEDIYDL